MMDVKVKKLTWDYVISSFDCGNEDLNDFLKNEAKNYASKRLSVTYIVEMEANVAAFFSLSNDKISIPDSDKATWRKIKSAFPHRKHRCDYPAVKIGRLAVSNDLRNHKIGSWILSFVKYMFLENSRSGCAFVTVDALREAVPFYQKNGFQFLNKLDKDSDSDTCLLYYNLAQLA